MRYCKVDFRPLRVKLRSPGG